MEGKMERVVGYCDQELLFSHPVRIASRAIHMSLDEALNEFECGRLDMVLARNNKENFASLKNYRLSFDQELISITR